MWFCIQGTNYNSDHIDRFKLDKDSNLILYSKDDTSVFIVFKSKNEANRIYLRLMELVGSEILKID